MRSPPRSLRERVTELLSGEDKGDVARIIFYMVVRYEGENEEEDLEMTESILSTFSKSPRHGVRSTLLEWHE